MVKISCPHCHTGLKVPQSSVGEVGRCPKCRETFTATATNEAPNRVIAKLEQIADEDIDTSPKLLVVGQTAKKATQVIGGGLVRIGGTALEWNRARQMEKARKQEEIAKREQERIDTERNEQAKPIPCPFCGEPISRDARKCRHCQEYLDVNLRPGQTHAPQIVINNANTNTVQANATAIVAGIPQKRFSRIVALVLSLLIPGLGQLYTGRMLAGIAWFVFVAIGYVCFVIPGIVLHLLCAISAGMTDPYR